MAPRCSVQSLWRLRYSWRTICKMNCSPSMRDQRRDTDSRLEQSLSSHLSQLRAFFFRDKHAWLLRVRALGKLELDDGADF